MKKSAKRIFYLLLFVIIAVAAAMTVAVASRTSPYDGKISAASAPDAQMTALATANGGIKQIAAGDYDTMILFENGEVYGVGWNIYGALGIGDRKMRYTFERVSSLSGKGIISIALGEHHTVALGADGTVYSAGYNAYGQLGLGDVTLRSTFEPVPFLSGKGIKSIACGLNHTMALSSDGTVYCAGRNEYGQLGMGDNLDRQKFTEVSVLNGVVVKSIACGGNKTILLDNSNKYYAAGDNRYYQLGLRSYQDEKIIVFTYDSAMTGYEFVACGGEHIAVLRSDGVLYTGGENSYGQLGLGARDSQNHNLQYVQSMYNSGIRFKSVSCGYRHTMALAENGTVYATGYNYYGQLGQRNTTDQYTFAKVLSLSGKEITFITCGGYHTIALGADSTVYVTGRNDRGQLGLGDYENRDAFTKISLDYSIKFDANGGYSITDKTVTETSQKNMPYHILTPLTANPFKHDGKVFAGWSTAPDGDVEYADKEEVVFLSDINTERTLYAVWKTPESTVKADMTNITYGEGKINLSFDYTAYADLTYKYQWYKDGKAVEGATNATLTPENVNESGAYKVEITATFTYAGLEKTESASAFSNNETAIIINKAALSPTLEIADREYDGTAAADPVVSGNICNGEVTYFYEGTTNGGESYASNSAPVDAGEYTLKIKIAETDNTFAYETPAGEEWHFRITPSKAAPTVEFGNSYTYGGEAIADPVLPDVTDGRAITFLYTGTTNGGREYSSDVPPTEAGTYSVTITVAASANYERQKISREFTIARKALDELAVSLDGWIYGHGGDAAPVVTGNYSNEVEYLYAVKNADGTYTPYTEDIHVADVGEYTVTAIVQQTDNYQSGTANCAFVIAKAKQEPKVNIKDLMYGDKFTLKIDNVCESGEVTLSFSGQKNDGTSVNGSTMPEAAGNYVLTLSIAATEHYDAFTQEYSFTIARKTVYPPYVADKLYTGESLTADVEMTDAQKKLFTVKENSGGTGAGKYPVKLALIDVFNHEWAAGSEISGDSNELLTLYFNIVEGISENVWEEEPGLSGNGGVAYGDAIVTAGRAKYGEMIVMYKTADGTAMEGTPKDVGTYLAVFDVAATADYMGLHKEVPFTISPRKITVTIDDKSSVYDRMTVYLTYSVSDGTVLDGDDLEVTLTKAAGENVGTYAITGVSGNGNYDVTFVDGTYKIEKAEYDLSAIEFKDTAVTFDGQAHTLKVKGTLVGKDGVAVTVTYTYSIEGKESLTNVSDGSLTVTATFATESGNYNAPAAMTATLTIAPKELTAEMFTVAEGNYVYNGEAHKPAISPASTEAALTTSDYAVTVYGTNIDAGKGTIIVAGKGNYCGGATVFFDISKADITPTVTIDGWKYLEEAKTPVVSGNAGNGECTYYYRGETNGGVAYASSLAPTRAGTYTVTVTVAETGNYNAGTASCEFTIGRSGNPLRVEITGWAYGEQANAPIVIGNDDNGTENFSYKGLANDGTQYSSSSAPEKAGNYNVTVTIAETENYLTSAATTSFTIGKKIITAPQIVSAVYDYGYTLKAEVAKSEYYTVEQNRGGSEIGTYDVVLKLTDHQNCEWQSGVGAITGNNNENITLAFRIVGAANEWRTDPRVSDAKYGEAIRLVYEATYGNDTVKIEYKTALGAILPTAPTALGSYTVTITVAETEDYSGLTTSLEFNILPRPITVKIENKTSDYGEGLADLTFTVDGLAYDDTAADLNVVLTKDAGETTGTYAISGTWDNGNYAVTFVGGTYTIAKATYDMSGVMFADETITYDGEAHSLTVTGLPSGVSVEYIGNGMKNAGTYEVTARFTGDANYEAIADMTATLKINKAVYDLRNLRFDDKTVTYDEGTHSLTVSGLPAGVNVEYIGNGMKNAGTYEITAKFTGDANYEAIGDMIAMLTVKKAVYNMGNVKFADKSVTYDGEIHSLIVTGLPMGVNVEYAGNGKRNAGTYEITAKFTGDANFEAIADMTATLTIEKATYDMTNVKFADETVTYDGEIHSLTVTGLPAGVNVEYMGNGRKNAGTYKVTAKFTGDANYEAISAMTATLTVKKFVYNMGNVKFADKAITYDGEIHSLVVTGLPMGVSVEYFDNDKRNAGNYIVTAKFTIADTDNYEVEIDELTAILTIDEAVYDMTNVKFEDATITYDGETHSLVVTGLPAGVSVEYVGNGKRNAGTYEVTAKFSVADAENYKPLASDEFKATLTIDKAIYDMSNVKFADETAMYDGEIHSLNVTGLPSGVRVEYVGNGKKIPGIYEVTARFTGDANYAALDDMTATLTIDKATYDMSNVKFDNATVTYDGETHSLAVTGLPAGVRVEYVGNGKKNAGTYEVTARFTGDANYEAIADMTATLTVKKAVYDMSGVKFESGSFEYDGATHSLTLTGKLPLGVSVEYVGNDKSEAGTYEVTVKFTGDANYEAIPDMTATLTIVAKGGCGGMVADGFTVAGISLAALICAAIALRKAKFAKRKNK